MATTFTEVLASTGFIQDGAPAPGVRLGEDAQRSRRGQRFQPDASWHGASSLAVYFKFHDALPDEKTVSEWHREIWNEGFAPLLWVVSPDRIDLYNGFGRPAADSAQANLIYSFAAVANQLIELDQLAGHLAMETGQFWVNAPKVTRKTGVDVQLLNDLAFLEKDLVQAGMARASAQGLIGRTIFTQYLVDRGILTSERLLQESGDDSLTGAFRNSVFTQRLFSWLAQAFNGDMFPAASIQEAIDAKHFARVADFLDATDPVTGQGSFFPYQFDIIPVELISSIYEQFAHSKIGALATDVLANNGAVETPAIAKKRGVHYTRLPVVSLILDEVLDGASGRETVLDLTCGSGVFLVEAFRRLVHARGGLKPTRSLIREILYSQVFGVDISDAAVRVAAFSLYLAALELDPEPVPPEALRFERLIGRTLFIGDANNIEQTPHGKALKDNKQQTRKFDIIVGNPPWTFRGKEGSSERRQRQTQAPQQSRGESLDFVARAMDFAHQTTRYGIVLSAMPFFAQSRATAAATRNIVQQLAPVTLVNVAPLKEWLFPTATMPAMILLARHRELPGDQITLVNVQWSPSSEKSYSLEVSPADITSVSLAAWGQKPELLKAAAFGRRRDIVLLEDLQRRNGTFDSWLKSIGSQSRDGLILGKEEQRTYDSSMLMGLPFLETKDLKSFFVPHNLGTFEQTHAQRPRDRASYVAPLLLIKEFFNKTPRPITALSLTNIVYSDAYFGAALGSDNAESGLLVSGILGSSLAAWFFLITSSEFGLFKRRLLKTDVGKFPLPDIKAALSTQIGQRIVKLVKTLGETEEAASLEAHGDSDNGLLVQLDAAVQDLYGLDTEDRHIVEDGYIRAGWQWHGGRNLWAAPVHGTEDLRSYSEAFMNNINRWLGVTKQRRVRANILQISNHAPLRAVQFCLEDGYAPPSIDIHQPSGTLPEILDQIGSRMGVKLGTALVGERELRVHGPNEVIIIKPAARRFWMTSAAIADSDAVVAESFSGIAS